MLRQRLPGYRRAEHLGEAIYLFVRAVGLAPEAGIWRHRFDHALIDAADAALAGVHGGQRMSAYRFTASPLELADTPWRPLDRALLRWTLGHGGSPLLARVAAWASFADGEGDTALPLAGDDAGRHGMPVLEADARRRAAQRADGRRWRHADAVRDRRGRPFLPVAQSSARGGGGGADTPASRRWHRPPLSTKRCSTCCSSMIARRRCNASAKRSPPSPGASCSCSPAAPAPARPPPCCACCWRCSARPTARRRPSRSARPPARRRSGWCSRCARASRRWRKSWTNRGRRCWRPFPTPRR